MKGNIHLTPCGEEPRNGLQLEAGRLIFENLPEEVRPQWASLVLASLVELTGVTSPPIEHILRIASQPSEWKKAHEAFSSARKVTLELERLGGRRSAEQTFLLKHLLLAELVAKVIYNSTNPPDEFDEDSGWWIAVCLKDVLDSLGVDAISRSL